MTKSIPKFTVLTAAVFALLIFASAAPAADLQWDPAVVRGTLDNGLSYYIRANHKPEKRVEIRLAVKAGSLFELDHKNGLAHFIEHMGFNGTAHFKSGELVKYFESIGAEWGPDTNAYTTMDHTQYMLSLPVDQPEPLEKGILTMADYGGGILFEPLEIEKEKGVILEELRLGRNVEERMFEKTVAIVLKGTRYPDRLTIGKKEDIASFEQQDFKDFYGKWYRPDLMAISVVGDIDPAAVEKLIKDNFSYMPKPSGAEQPPIYNDVEHKDIRAGIITDPEMPVSASVIIFTRPPARTLTVADYRRDIVRDIAYGIYNARIKEITLKPNPPFKEASAGEYWNMMGMDIIAIYALDEMKKEKKALAAMVTEVERIRRHGILDEELAEQKRNQGEQLRALVEEKDKLESAGIVADISSGYIYGNVYTDVEQRKRLFDEMKDSITKKEVQDELEKLFAPVNMSVLLMMPEFQKSMYKPDELLKTVDEARKADIKPYEREKIVRKTNYDALKPGKITDRKTFDNIGVTRVQFENGLRVLIKPTDFQKDEITFSSFVPGGVLYETYADRGLMQVAVASLIEGGTKELTSVQIDRLLSGKTIGVSAGFRENYSLNGKTVGKDFEETLQWVRDYITQPGFRPEAVQKAKAVIIDSLDQQRTEQDGSLRITLQEMLCPGGPIAYTPTDDEIKAATPEQIKSFHDLNTAPSKMEFTFVGNLDVEKTIQLAAKYLGSLPARSAAPIPEAARSCTLPQGYTRRTIYRGMENRSVVIIAFPGPATADPDRAAAEVMAKVADIRMNKILREEMSGTYYAYLYAANNGYIRGRDFIYGGLATDPGKVDEMINAAMKIFRDIAEGGPTDEEFNSAKEISAKHHEEELKQNDYWLGIINGKDTDGLPLDTDLKFKDAIQQVTTDQIKAAAAKYLLGRTRVELIVLPEKIPEKKDEKKEEPETDKK